MLNNFFTIGLRAKNSIARNKGIGSPTKSGNVPIFDL
jgi:hypothetical protein